MITSEIEQRLGKKLFDHQLDCIENADSQSDHIRQCYYYPTGKGKTITALATLAHEGESECVVIAPPATHSAWFTAGQKLDIHCHTISHQKFRQSDFKLNRKIPVIADEFHLFGGHDGKGWKKLDRLARGLQAALILMSATPNYNDADRVYCIKHILDPHGTKGGFLEWVYQNCITEQNYFGIMPKVIGFHRYANAAEYLADLPNVMYLPDDLVYTITDHPIKEKIPKEMADYGYNRRRHRMIASQMEEKHTKVALSLVNHNGFIEGDVMKKIYEIIGDKGQSVMIFVNHSKVAEALQHTMKSVHDVDSLLVTGDNTVRSKDYILNAFKKRECDILIGTASIATGPDGLDKVCDTMIILDDTDDDSLRRQLIGRIMPRGEDTDATNKKVFRLVLS